MSGAKLGNVNNQPQKMKKLLPFTTLLIIAFFAGNSYAQDKGLLTNKYKAPDFEIQLSAGKNIRLSDLKGKIVLINFFSTSCSPCRAELPMIQKHIWKKHGKNDNFELLVIARDNSTEDIAKYLSLNTAIKFPIYPDTKRTIYQKYAKIGVPQNFVIDKEGNVLYHVTGYYEAEFLNMVNLINELLK